MKKNEKKCYNKKYPIQPPVIDTDMRYRHTYIYSLNSIEAKQTSCLHVYIPTQLKHETVNHRSRLATPHPQNISRIN